MFCNFGQLYKVDSRTLDLWVKIINSVPRSVLWLLSFPSRGQGQSRSSVILLSRPVRHLLQGMSTRPRRHSEMLTFERNGWLEPNGSEEINAACDCCDSTHALRGRVEQS